MKLEIKIVTTLRKMGENFTEKYIDFAYRVVKRGTVNKPIKIRLITLKKILEILKQKKNL